MAQRLSPGPWLAGATLIASGAALWFFYPRNAPAPAAEPAPPPPALAVAPEPVPEVEHPIESTPPPPLG